MVDPNELHQRAFVRSLRAKNRSKRTIDSYLESLGQLVDFHAGADLADLAKPHIEDYLADVLETRSATTAALRFRSLRAFYNWAEGEEIVELSPMHRMVEPKITDVPPEVLTDGQLRALLSTCVGKSFEDRRDNAILRIFCEPGSPRVSEMAGLSVEDLKLDQDMIRLTGKGSKVRFIPFGAKTGQAIDRYLRVRNKHRRKALPDLWLGGRGMALTDNGIRQMLRRRSQEAGIGHVHPHQLRHTAAHDWADRGGSEDDAMALFGWASREMAARYGRSARLDRAQRASRRASPADRL